VIAAVRFGVAALALTVTGCATRQPVPAPAPQPPPGVDRPAERALPTAAYLDRVASLDLYMIRSGELALQRSAVQGHRDFAQRMIEGHRGLASQLSMAGRRLDLLPSNMLQAEHQGWLDLLAATTSAAQFDGTYRRQQLAAHAASYRAHAAYAHSGQSPTLRMTARSAAGIEQEHSRMMRMM
jgi:putative membrane protein